MLECPHGGPVEVIVVVVGEKYAVDGRQCFEVRHRRDEARRADERDGRDTLRPDRVGEEVESGKLQEEGRVPDPGDPYLGVLDAWASDLGRAERELFRPGIGCLPGRDPLPRHFPEATPEGVIAGGLRPGGAEATVGSVVGRSLHGAFLGDGGSLWLPITITAEWWR
jgi:hypothetical protein